MSKYIVKEKKKERTLISVLGFAKCFSTYSREISPKDEENVDISLLETEANNEVPVKVKQPRKNQTIRLWATEIACIVGAKSYCSKDQILDRIWQFYQPSTFPSWKSTTNTIADLVAKDVQTSFIFQNIREGISSATDSEITKQFVEEAQSKIMSRSVFSLDEKQRLCQALQTLGYTEHGTKKEDGTAQAITKQLALTGSSKLLLRDHEVFLKTVLELPSKEPLRKYVIVGKVDGVLVSPFSREVVEIKNRVDREIFDAQNIQEMDRIQLLTYMALTHTHTSFLVQHYCDDLKWTLVQDFGNAEFNSFLPKIVDFLKLVDSIIFNTNPSMREDYMKYRFLKANNS